MLESTAFPNGAMRWLILLLAVDTMDVPNSSLMVELKERLEEFKAGRKGCYRQTAGPAGRGGVFRGAELLG